MSRFSKRQKLLLAAILLTYLLDVLLLISATQVPFAFYHKRLNSFEVGQVAEFDVVAESDVTYTDEGRTNDLREEQAEAVLPVYIIDEGKILEQIGHFERLASFFAGTGWELDPDSLYEELSLRFPNQFTRQDAEILASSKELSDFFPIIEENLRILLERGIFSSAPQHLQSSEQDSKPVLELWHWRENEKVHEPYSRAQLLTIDEIDQKLEELFSSYDIGSELKMASTLLLEKFAIQTAFYSPALTSALKEEAKQRIEPFTYHIDKGERIIEEGEVVTRGTMQSLQALIDQRPQANLKESLAISMYLAGIFFLAYIMYAPLLQKSRRAFQHSYILLVSSFIFSLNLFFVLSFSLAPVGIPISLAIMTALISMMVATLVTQRVGIITSLLLSLFFLSIPSVDVFAFMFSFLTGITGTYLIRNAERRIDLVSATVKLAVVVVFILVSIGLFQQKPGTWYLSAAGLGMVHAFVTGALNLALLPVLEHLLNAPTVFRLRELSDTNTPLFKRMITVAPGTYSHSMSVANLAESACREIGANHLLARVGAYYHDIGKMDQPEYFIENQESKNKHDELSPNLSVAVIKSHVKIGKEKAKELKLPPEVVEIVSDHHGSDVISYFYQQAMKKSEGNVSQSEFSYNGTPPRSKEAAVVMLADTIEAQSRTIKKPTIQKFEKMVWDAIMLKVGRKQLSNSILSFQDIEKIKNSFVQILAGQFHNRIEYPDQKE